MTITSSIAAPELDPVAEKLLVNARLRSRLDLGGRERATRWVSALAFLAAAGSMAAFAHSGRSLSLWPFALLVVSYALASRVGFEVGSGFALPTELVLVPMLFFLPATVVPLAVALGVVLGHVPAYLNHRAPLERAVVTIGSSWYAFGPALVFLAAGEPSARVGGWWVLAVALPAQYLADLCSSAATERLALRLPVRDLLQPLLWAFTVDTLLASVGLAGAVAATTTRIALLLPLPLLALLQLFARQRQRGLDHLIELSTAYKGTAYLLGDVIEADDQYTGAHSRAVVDLALAICDRLGLDARQRQLVEFTALLHDVGKIKIPSEIITKRGPLTPDERTIIETHTVEGERLLRPVGGILAAVGHTVRSCHERYDGNGYPDRLAGEEIPLIARIVSCCDAYNAMTTDRPYRGALSLEQAHRELVVHRGSQFDPVVVDTLLALLADLRPPLNDAHFREALTLPGDEVRAAATLDECARRWSRRIPQQ